MYKYWNQEKKNETFAEKLRKLRVSAGLTQEDLARQLCLSRSCISNYENGTRYPDLETIRRLADHFNVFADYLMSTSDYITMPLEKDKLEEYCDISRRVAENGDSIDLSGIPLAKKLVIMEFSEYVINTKDRHFRKPIADEEVI